MWGGSERRVRDCVCARAGIGPLEVVTRLDLGRAAAELTGELDVYTARELGAALTEIQKRARRPRLVLVLTNLAVADSCALGVMIAAVKRAKQAGGGVALVEVPEFFAKICGLPGLPACCRRSTRSRRHWRTSTRRRPAGDEHAVIGDRARRRAQDGDDRGRGRRAVGGHRHRYARARGRRPDRPMGAGRGPPGASRAALPASPRRRPGRVIRQRASLGHLVQPAHPGQWMPPPTLVPYQNPCLMRRVLEALRRL